MLTLGINYSQMHDSSACIVRDGELLFAVAEERISRLKHDSRFPQLAILACLEFAQARAEQLDEVCFGWQTAWPAYRHDLKLYALGKWPITYLNLLNSTRHFASMWHQESGVKRFAQHFGQTKARIRFVDHHLAHAISAYAYSGFEDSAIVVMDGRGAWEATSIWRGSKGRIVHVATIPFPDSLGLFYSEFTEYLGFQRNSDEWKVMGLAPYGAPGIKLDAFIEPEAAPYRVNHKRLLGNGNGSFSGMTPLLGPAPTTESPWEPRWLRIWTGMGGCRTRRCAMLILVLRSTTLPSKQRCIPINCATRALVIPRKPPPNFCPTVKSWDGFRGEWNSVRGRWEAARFWRTRAIRK